MKAGPLWVPIPSSSLAASSPYSSRSRSRFYSPPPTEAYADDYVAETGGVQYTSLEDAFKNVAKDGTIKMLAGYSAPSYIYIETSCTLDLNGYEVGCSSTSSLYKFALYVDDRVTFTLEDTAGGGRLHYEDRKGVKVEGVHSKMIMNSGSIYAPVGVQSKMDTSFEMNGGRIIATSQCVELADGGIFTMNGGYLSDIDGPYRHGAVAVFLNYGSHFTMNGGEINMSLTAIEASKSDRCHIEINGGTVRGGQHPYRDQWKQVIRLYDCKYVTLDISGGTIEGPSDYFAIYTVVTSGTINMTGGVINSGQAVYADYLKDSWTNRDPYIYISGGDILCSSRHMQDIIYMDSKEADYVKVSGGHFHGPVLKEWCADGYWPTKLADEQYAATNPYSVIRIEDVVAELTGNTAETQYLASVDEAFAVAQDGATIKLRGAKELGPVTVKEGDTVTLDLFGSTLEPTDTNSATFNVQGTLNVIDTGTSGTASSLGSDSLNAALFNVTGSGMLNLKTGANYTSGNTIINVDGDTASASVSDGYFTGGKETITLGSASKDKDCVSLTGGTFKNYNPADASNLSHKNMCADGYGVEKQYKGQYIDYVVTKGEAQAVDEYDNPGKIYATLQDALDADLESGQHLRLIDNVGTRWSDGWISKKDVTLDLNGKTITGALNIPEGTLTLTDSSSGQIGKICAEHGAPVVVSENATFNLQSGTLQGSSEGVMAYGAARINISGGTLQGANAVSTVNDEGMLSITGGKFNATGSQDISTTYTGFASAGLYAHEVPASQLAEGYSCVANTDEATKSTYPWTVAESPSIAKIGDTEYKKLDAAIAASKAGDTIELLMDVELSEAANFAGKDATLDLAGYTLQSAGNVVSAGDSAKLTIKDSSAAQTGKVSSTGDYNYAVAVSGTGSVTVASGSIESAGPAGIAVLDSDATAKVSVEGGTVAGKEYAVVSSAPESSVAISGGKITGSGTADAAVYGAEGTVAVSGGTFNKAVPVEQCAEGYIPAINGDGTYTVTQGYVITFAAVGGSPEPDTQYVKAGDKVTEPTISRTGYDFQGWFYTNAEGAETEFDFAQAPTASMELYAKWEGSRQDFTVTFLSNGEEVGTQTVKDGNKATKPVDPTYEDHAFTGWYTEYHYGDLFDFENTSIVKNITLYAHWTEKVASIGDTYYGSLQEAVNAAQPGDTIKVLKDINLDTTTTATSKVTFIDKDVTLDLNGQSVSSSFDSNGIGLYVYGGSLKLTDSAGNGKLSGTLPLVLVDVDSFEMDSGTIAGLMCGFTVNNTNGTKANVKMTGGSIEARFGFGISTSGSNVDLEVSGGSVKVANDFLTTPTSAISQTGSSNTLSISGGTFAGSPDNETDVTSTVSDGFITGGHFSKQVPYEQCATGYHPVAKTDESGTYYTVEKGKAVASITKNGSTIYYTSLGDAVDAAAEDGDTIKLLESVEDDSQVVVNHKTITLDLNGKTYSVTSDVAFAVNGGKLTVTDSSEAGNGSIQGAFTAVKLSDTGSLDLQKGALAVTGSDANAKAVWVNGGPVGQASVNVSDDGVINGGSGSGIYLGGTGTTLTVEGGLISGGTYAINDNDAGNTLVIKDGIFSSESDTADIFMPESEGDAVSGGTFMHAVPLEQCAPGYIPATNDDGTYTVAEGYVVDFDANGGKFTDDSENLTQTVKKGEKATQPEEPTYEGYTFAGWYTDAEGDTEFNFDAAPTKDTTVVAHWTKNPTKVEVPELTVAEDLSYNGTEQEGVKGFSYEAEGYKVSGNAAAINAGDYELTLTLEGGYVWANGSSDSITVDWSIDSKPVTIKVNDKSMVAGGGQPEYTGTVEGVIEGDDLKVTYGLKEGSDVTKPGTYDIIPVSAEENANYEVASIEPGTLTVSEAVATVTREGKTFYYADLQDAIDGAQDGDTITMVADVKSDSYIVIAPTTAKNITLDLNGHSFVSTSADAIYAKGGVYTIKDSSEVGTGYIEGASCAVRAGGSDFTLESGTLKTTQAGNALKLYGIAQAVEGTYDVVIKGGTIEGGEGTGIVVDRKCASLTVEGGEVTGSVAISYSDTDNTLSITGGKIAGTSGTDIFAPESEGGFVSGGVFAHEVPSAQCAEGYIPAANTDEATKSAYPYTVAQGYVIDFDANEGKFSDGSDNLAQTVKAGEKVAEPEQPTRGGYTFAGWYTDAQGDTKFDFNVAPTGDTTVVAHWTQEPAPIESYTVTFDAHGGTLSGEATQTVESGKTAAKPDDPTREGYDFRAWTTDEAGEVNFDFATPITVDTTLYAQWTKKVEPVTECTVTFNANGGVLTGDAAQTVKIGEKASKPSDPTYSGYTFKGWTTDEAGENEFDFANTVITKDITLYAQWEKTPEPEPEVTTYTVTFDANGGALAGASTETVEEGKFATEPLDPFREGYKFAGWFTAAEGGTEYFVTPSAITENTTLYAHWAQGVDPEVFEVTVEAHGGAFADGSTSKTLVAEAGGKLTGLENPVRDGYEFRAWTTDAAGENVFDPATDVITDEITLYAQWTKKVEPVVSYQVTFDANGGTIEGQSGMAVSVESGKTVEKPADPTREGYTFKGWFTAAEGGSAFDFATAITGDITLYAQWEKKSDPTPTPTPDPQPTPDPGVNPGSGDSGNGGSTAADQCATGAKTAPQTGDSTLPFAAGAAALVIAAAVTALVARRKLRRH